MDTTPNPEKTEEEKPAAAPTEAEANAALASVEGAIRDFVRRDIATPRKLAAVETGPARADSSFSRSETALPRSESSLRHDSSSSRNDSPASRNDSTSSRNDIASSRNDSASSRAESSYAPSRSESSYAARSERPESAAPAAPAEAGGGVELFIRQTGGASIKQIDSLIEELQVVRDFLVAEGERVQREVANYAQVSHTALSSAKIILDSMGQWKSAAGSLRHSRD